MFLHFWETECEQRRGRERGRHRIRSRLQAPSCQHRARRGARPTNGEIMTWADVGRLTDWATQVPPMFLFAFCFVLGFFVLFLFFFKFFLTFIYFWDRERDRAWTGEGQREGYTESETGSRLWAVSTEPDVGLELTDREIMTWAEVGCLTDWATQVPQICYALMFSF